MAAQLLRAGLREPRQVCDLARMKQGRSPRVIGGTWRGQTCDVDHVIPVKSLPASGTVNLNKTTALIAARPLKDFADLYKVRGIGPKTIVERWRELVDF